MIHPKTRFSCSALLLDSRSWSKAVLGSRKKWFISRMFHLTSLCFRKELCIELDYYLAEQKRLTNYNLLNETFGPGELWKRQITLNRLHQMTAKRIRMVKKAFRLKRKRQRNNDPKLWIIVPDSSENRDSNRPGGGQGSRDSSGGN